MNKIRILELFGGIGACTKALKRLGFDVEVVDYVEINKHACKSYNAINGTDFQPQDITTWDKDVSVDLIMHGSPCQDFSLAGKQAGGDKDSGTRSSLMYETIRIVEKLKPKYVIWENVKNLLSKKHRHNFDAYLKTMESLGYKNYYQVLNAKDYGIPQNRERVFTISILKEEIIYDDYNSSIRKDQDTIGTLTCNCGSSAIRNGWKIIECNDNFEFPPKQELKLKLKDMLEDEVDEKYYLSDKMMECFLSDGTGRYPRKKRFLQNLEGYLEANEGDGVALAIKEKHETTTATKTSQLRIRKLIPLEAFRVMGFDDEDCEKAQKVNSDAQLYKQAGNSIVVNVLEAIFKELL